MAVRKFNRVLLVTLLVSGCSMYDRVSPGFHRNHFQRFSYDITSENWMSNPYSSGFLMSKDGYDINYIYVSREKLNTDLGLTRQRFLEGMEPVELSDVDKDRIRSNGATANFSVQKDEPVKIDGHRGYRMEYAYTTFQGLDVRGIRCGFIHDRWMYLIVYEGLKEHYFEKNRADFEEFLSSFKVL